MPNHGWCKLKNLKELYLNSNELEGIFPPCLGNLSSLRSMDIYFNQFNGNIASTLISNLISLERLWLRHNHIEVPMSLKPLANLSNLMDFEAANIVLDLDSQFWTPRFQLQSLILENSLFYESKPHLPSFLYYQNDLRSITLFGCDFGGAFPSWMLENNTLLESIDLGGNYFTGPLLLPSHSNLGLFDIDISDNQLQGQIPTNMSMDFPKLVSLQMSNNYFEGPISSEFCKIHELDFLDLSENDLSGSIPRCLSELPHISHVHLNNNRLRGRMPHGFLNNSSIQVIDLSDNSFNGIIPSLIGNITRLIVLLLRANQFHGEIPIGLCNLSQISLLDLSLNNLSGRLPICLSNLNFEASLGHDFTGYVREIVEFKTKSRSLNYSVDITTYMFGFDLSCNKFSGEISPEFGNLSNIKSLNLSHNKLTGSIPVTFSNLKQIESLDLSYNYLIGLVPSQLTELNFLADFKVAHNNLSGPLPDEKGQFITFDNSSYEGNPFLCGPPLTKSCRETTSLLPSPNAFLGEDEDDGLMDTSAFYVTFVVSYVMVLMGIAAVLYINPYWRRAWFHLIEVCITACYYFIEDNFLN